MLVAVQAGVARLVQCGFEAPTWQALLAHNGPRPLSVEDESPRHAFVEGEMREMKGKQEGNKGN